MNEKIAELIDRSGTAFIASVDSAGFPLIKAMLAPRKREGLTQFWFTTNTSSMRVKQYRENPKASVYFCDQQSFEGLLLSGHMQVLEDKASKEMIWQEGDNLYYPGGVNDQDYCVLLFKAYSYRYYSNFSSESFSITD